MGQHEERQPPSGPWDLVLPDNARFIELKLGDKTLREVHLGAIYKTDVVGSRVGLLPEGLRYWWGQFQRSLHISMLWVLQAITTTHGALLLLKDERMQEPASLHGKLSRLARGGNRELAGFLKRADMNFKFSKHEKYGGHIYTLEEAGKIKIVGVESELGSIMGLDQGKALTYCSMMSMSTFGEPGFDKAMEEEFTGLWNHMEERTAVMKVKLAKFEGK